MKRAIILPCLVTAFVALSPVGVALADNPHFGRTVRVTAGQPNKSIEDPSVTSIPAGFNTDGFDQCDDGLRQPGCGPAAGQRQGGEPIRRRRLPEHQQGTW